MVVERLHVLLEREGSLLELVRVQGEVEVRVRRSLAAVEAVGTK